MAAMAASLKFFKRQVEPKPDARHRVKWRFRIAESFSSSIQDDGHGSNLETLKIKSDSELLKAIWSDSQDGHHGTV